MDCYTRRNIQDGETGYSGRQTSHLCVCHGTSGCVEVRGCLPRCSMIFVEMTVNVKRGSFCTQKTINCCHLHIHSPYYLGCCSGTYVLDPPPPTQSALISAVLESKAFGQAKSPAQLPHPDLSQDGAGGGGKPFGSSSTTKAAAAAVVAATAGGHAAGLALATSPAGGEIEAEGVGSDAAGVLSRVHAWIEGVLLPAITKQVWD